MRRHTSKMQYQTSSLPKTKPGVNEVQLKNHLCGLFKVIRVEVTKQMNEACKKSIRNNFSDNLRNGDHNERHA